jgi:hypothetical protein
MADQGNSTLIGRFFDRLKARLARNDELNGLTQADLEYLATELGLTSAEFRAIATWVGDHSGQMEQVMRLRGLDPDLVRRRFGGLMRQMEVFCAQCKSVGRCRRELDSGTAAKNVPAFCANAGTIDDLAASVS